MKTMNYLRFAALMAAIVMTMTAQAKTQDWGGRVIDEKGEPMPFVNVVLLWCRRQAEGPYVNLVYSATICTFATSNRKRNSNDYQIRNS